MVSDDHIQCLFFCVCCSISHLFVLCASDNAREARFATTKLTEFGFHVIYVIRSVHDASSLNEHSQHTRFEIT